MKKNGIHIIGYTEQKYATSNPVSYKNKDGFELTFSEENEVKMGLFASSLIIQKNDKDISSKFFTNSYLSTIPHPYDAFSFSGRFCLIPTCPILNDPLILIIDTINLTKEDIYINGSLESNQFALNSEKVLINAYTKNIVYDCVTNEIQTIKIPFESSEVEFAHWIDFSIIRFLISPKNDTNLKILNYNLQNDTYEIFELITPSEVFGFDEHNFEEIMKLNTMCLFNSKGYSFSSPGSRLNKWMFERYDKKLNLYILSTYAPVSGIYYNKNWEITGISIVKQNIEFDFNKSNITGKENSDPNIGNLTIPFQPFEKEIPESTSEFITNKLRHFWSKLKVLVLKKT